MKILKLISVCFTFLVLNASCRLRLTSKSQSKLQVGDTVVLLSIQWRNTYCKSNPSPTCAALSQEEKLKWNIHGMWPAVVVQENGQMIAKPDTSTKVDAETKIRDAIKETEALGRKVDTYWKNLLRPREGQSAENVQFAINEYKKHGYDYSADDYLRTTFHLYKNVVDSLKAGIEAEISVSKTEIASAKTFVEELIPKKVGLSCVLKDTKLNLLELRVLFRRTYTEGKSNYELIDFVDSQFKARSSGHAIFCDSASVLDLAA